MSKIKIFIDPGHGGSDRANKGPTGYIEADGMLDLSLKLRDELLSTGAFEVKMSREKDATVALRERGNMAARWGANMFISQHSNAYNGKTKGVEVFYSIDIPNDKPFATKLANVTAQVLNTTVRGVKIKESNVEPGEDYYAVIDAAQDGGVKHVFLIENGFHDNIDEEKLLKDPNVRLAIAKAQAKAICEFYGVQYPKKVEELDWKQKIVKEALDLGLITDPAWVNKAEETPTIWFVCAIAINIFKKSKG